MGCFWSSNICHPLKTVEGRSPWADFPRGLLHAPAFLFPTPACYSGLGALPSSRPLDGRPQEGGVLFCLMLPPDSGCPAGVRCTYYVTRCLLQKEPESKRRDPESEVVNGCQRAGQRRLEERPRVWEPQAFHPNKGAAGCSQADKEAFFYLHPREGGLLPRNWPHGPCPAMVARCPLAEGSTGVDPSTPPLPPAEGPP